jgi:CheY-like chemotaxis protein
MSEGPFSELEGRVLPLAPTRKDAEVAVRVFAPEGLTLTVCNDMAEVCAEMQRGAAVAVVPDEAILRDDGRCLARVLEAQPPWSDFPLIVLTAPQQTRAAARCRGGRAHGTRPPPR